MEQQTDTFVPSRGTASDGTPIRIDEQGRVWFGCSITPIFTEARDGN